MYQLNDQQIDLILADLRQRGIETESMRMNLLDHICILIENHLDENGDFAQFYATTIRSFYKDELRELEDEARLLMALNKGCLLLSRNQFFLLLFALLIGPFITYDLVWMFKTGSGWFIPSEIWVSTFVFALYPLLVLLVLFLTPDRFDPLIPHKAKILLGGRSLIRVLAMDTAQ
ncbi:MAG TPA: hypothetical protein VHC96_07270 [Puia sp.]|jgi:hypothetical protein|nr:hypothetical protein [Puia sp.]